MDAGHGDLGLVLRDALGVITDAVRLDGEGQLRSALDLYLDGIERLMGALPRTSHPGLSTIGHFLGSEVLMFPA
jgi:hypothetical protein